MPGLIFGGVNNVYFTDTEKYAIILNSPYASYVIITRQDRILIYVSIVFIILSVVCIRKSKSLTKIVSQLVYILLCHKKIILFTSKEERAHEALYR